MGFLQNTWLNYWDRSYQQIKTQLLTRMQQRVPEITDHTESNLFVKIISIFAAIAEMLGYYIDNAAREAHVDSARLYASMVSHARRVDYRVRGKLAANTEVVFSLEETQPTDVTILNGTLISNRNLNIRFVTTANAVIPAGSLISNQVGAVQLYEVNQVTLADGTGLPNQEIIVGTDVADNTVVVRVGGVVWDRVDSLIFGTPVSTIYRETVNKNKEHVIIFGDGIAGEAPASGVSIEVDYKGTDGILGNIEVGEIDTVDEVIGSFIVNVTNVIKAVGGSDVESLEQLKRRIPLALRTKERGVTEQDYIDVAELASGVAKAGLSFKNGNNIDIFIVPDGGGLANQVLREYVEEWFKTRKLVGRKVRVFSAGELRVKLKIRVVALPNYRNVDIENALRARLIDYISYKYLEINGELNLGDVYERLETLPGVKNSRVDIMTTVPYARPLFDNVPQLTWTKEVKEASTATSFWQISFITNTDYQILKDNGFIGDFVIGQTVTLPEIEFTITGNYTTGDQWEFITYPYFGSIFLQEPSIPVAYASDIEITVTGGL